MHRFAIGKTNNELGNQIFSLLNTLTKHDPMKTSISISFALRASLSLEAYSGDTRVNPKNLDAYDGLGSPLQHWLQ